jgi:hypothetical protein
LVERFRDMEEVHRFESCAAHSMWWTLILVAILYLVSAYLSYADEIRQGRWYLPVTILLGLAGTSVWVWVARELDDNKKIYVYSLCWDTIMVTAFYVVPLFFFGVKIDRWSMVGLALMITGFLIIKCRS